MSEGIEISEDSALVEPDDAATGEAIRADLSEKQRTQMRAVWEWVFVVVIAIGAALLIRLFLFQQYYIDGPSMQTTLMPQDRVLVNKMSYKLHDIHRGDVIVFDRVTNETQHDDLIKRVMGLAGETLEIRSCIVYVDGVLVDEPYLNPEQTSQIEPSARCGSHTDMAPTVVPEHTVFVMGDNRVQSFDSRDFGPIDTDKVRGRAFVVIWPASAWAWL
ncbi:MAG: signal peptidase I [Actinobacteria bacterium]|uniref:signal peptidase I n=1 Tax=freshwater metagenome TaxID=449393 RepID=A0A6J7DR93_9ZZZZ|nr:signal peptidase I [Actinomycetota bacterium]MUH56498.1 signal peptidase I [Actinomycetota bacterium]